MSQMGFAVGTVLSELYSRCSASNSAKLWVRVQSVALAFSVMGNPHRCSARKHEDSNPPLNDSGPKAVPYMASSARRATRLGGYLLPLNTKSYFTESAKRVVVPES